VFQEKIFPDPTSPYAVMIPGGVLDRTRMESFFDTFCAQAKPEQREKYGEKMQTIIHFFNFLRFRRGFIDKHFELAKKQYQSLHISDREFAVLTGLMFWRSGITIIKRFYIKHFFTNEKVIIKVMNNFFGE
jgi:hypothetical protein